MGKADIKSVYKCNNYKCVINVMKEKKHMRIIALL